MIAAFFGVKIIYASVFLRNMTVLIRWFLSHFIVCLDLKNKNVR